MSASLGRPEHAQANRLISRALAQRPALIVAHRGVAAGSVAENTAAATRAALRSGADIVELDVVSSTDGTFFVFHDGMEPLLLGTRATILSHTADEIRALRHLKVDPRRPGARVPELAELLRALPEEALINLDRSWAWWPQLLPWLDGFGVTSRILLKCHAGDAAALAALRAHAEPYPFVPICRTPEQAFALIADEALNTVGIEALADSASSPFADAGVIEELRERGVFVMANAEVLSSGPPLFAGFDDEVSIFDGEDAGWGALLDLGITVIQTDWPWLLRDYLGRRAVRV